VTDWFHQHPWKVTLIALVLVLEVVALLATRGTA
jgi:hypothetical protein